MERETVAETVRTYWTTKDAIVSDLLEAAIARDDQAKARGLATVLNYDEQDRMSVDGIRPEEAL